MAGASLFRSVVRGLTVAGRAAFVVGSLVALLHLTSPHDHTSVSEEQRCPACQVQRADGGSAPEPEPIRLAPPAESLSTTPPVAVDSAPRAARHAPGPARAPPVPSPSEPL
ncbi:MAG: hypothetical protein ACYDBY_07665 [Thermoanaerobaculia bacterium]